MRRPVLSWIPPTRRLLPWRGALDRRAVRKEFEARFTAERMARDYLDVYRGLMAKHIPWTSTELLEADLSLRQQRFPLTSQWLGANEVASRWLPVQRCSRMEESSSRPWNSGEAFCELHILIDLHQRLRPAESSV